MPVGPWRQGADAVLLRGACSSCSRHSRQLIPRASTSHRKPYMPPVDGELMPIHLSNITHEGNGGAGKVQSAKGPVLDPGFQLRAIRAQHNSFNTADLAAAFQNTLGYQQAPCWSDGKTESRREPLQRILSK